MIAPDEILRFSFDDVYHGFAECHGLMRLTEKSINFEYIVKDSILGVFKSKVKHLKLSYEQVIEAELINKLWSKKLIIKPYSMLDSRDLPITDKGEIHLKISRKKDVIFTADRLSTFINMRVAEIRLERIDR